MNKELERIEAYIKELEEKLSKVEEKLVKIKEIVVGPEEYNGVTTKKQKVWREEVPPRHFGECM